MPLFMDFHQLEGITLAEVRDAHIADVLIQDKYGVKYHQFWINEKAGTVFCLMEGPDKESCELVHREAHGNVACKIVEVESGFYQLMMGKDYVINEGVVLNKDGSKDPGFRNVLAIRILEFPFNQNAIVELLKFISGKILTFHGRKINGKNEENLLCTFDSASNALSCAVEVQKIFSNSKYPALVGKMGLASGQPVTKNDDLFGDTIELACMLSNIAGEREILLSSVASQLCSANVDDEMRSFIKGVNENDEHFITSLFNVVHQKLSEESFSIEQLCRDMGVSRPQLYRKTVNLAGKSPNDLIRDLRMNKALLLLRKKSLKIAQIALEVGYNNPSYFSKCFAERFGCKPSEIAENSVLA
jgi:AraC-like DNA-binding protein